MQSREEKFLLDLLDETKRLIVAKEVMKERRLSNYKEPHSKDGAPFARRATDIVYGEINNNLLTALMVNLGYRIPKKIYSLRDFGDFCNWLGADCEDGNQKWVDD